MSEDLAIWNFIYEFLFQYTGVEYGEMDLDTPEIAEIEDSLKIKLPESIKRWIVFSNNSEKISDRFSYRDCLEVGWLEAHDALSILLQGEDDYYWAIKRTDLVCADPTVFGYGLDYETDETSFIERGEWACSVSSFALDYILSYYDPIGGGFCCISDDDAIQDKLQLNMVLGDVRLSLCDDVLIFTNNNPLNWNDQTYKVYFLTRKSAAKRQDTVNWLKSNAKVIYTMGSYEI